MSQYPSPYQSPDPTGYFNRSENSPARQITAPCRRTSVLLFVFGGLLLLMGTCLGGMLWVPGMEEAIAKQKTTGLPPGVTFAEVRLQFTIQGILMAVVAILFIVFGFFVRKASKGATISTIVLGFLLIGWFLLQVVVGLAQGASLGLGGQAAAGACMLAIPLALTVWLVIWLFQSVAACSRLRAWQSQYASQHSQYPQNQAPWNPSQQNWQQPPNQWGQPTWPPQQQPPQQQQNWPPPPSNPT